MNVELRIIDVRGKGVLCAASSDTGESFWVPRGQHVEWSALPQPGEVVRAEIPEWLANKHRQLVGDVAYQRVRHANTQRNTQMANFKDNSGALFRVPDDEKKTDKWPDYKGDVLIDGVKWWVSGWVRTSEKSGKKYLSLAMRKAEEKPAEEKPKARAPAQAMAGEDIPFEMEFR